MVVLTLPKYQCFLMLINNIHNQKIVNLPHITTKKFWPGKFNLPVVVKTHYHLGHGTNVNSFLIQLLTTIWALTSWPPLYVQTFWCMHLGQDLTQMENHKHCAVSLDISTNCYWVCNTSAFLFLICSICNMINAIQVFDVTDKSGRDSGNMFINRGEACSM